MNGALAPEGCFFQSGHCPASPANRDPPLAMNCEPLSCSLAPSLPVFLLPRSLAPSLPVFLLPRSLAPLLPALFAVPRAMHHAQEPHPRPHGFAHLVRHDPRNLVQMRQIVRRPRGQQLRQSHRAECRMRCPPLEILRRQLQTAQFLQALRPRSRKFIQQLRQRFASLVAHVPLAIEGRKGSRLVRMQEYAGPAASSPRVRSGSGARSRCSRSTCPRLRSFPSTPPAIRAAAHPAPPACAPAAQSCSQVRVPYRSPQSQCTCTRSNL